MNLNLNSNTAKLYRWFYATTVMPNTLCPYFWKLVIMWIFIVPYSILSLPYVIMQYVSKEDVNGTSFLEKPASGAVLWAMTYFICAMFFSITIFWLEFPKDSFAQNMQMIGILLWIIVTGVSAWYGGKWAIEKWKRSKIKYDKDGYRIWDEPKKQDSVVVNFVKATYNKYCPKIDWE